MDKQELLKQVEHDFEERTSFGVELRRTGTQAEHEVTVVITTAEGEHHLPAEIVRAGSRTTITRLITRFLTRTIPKDTILITDYVSAKNAAILREAGIQFLDASGNCRIESGSLVIHIEGQRRTPQEFRRQPAFRKSGSKIIYALLVNDDLTRATVRDLAALTGVSHGTVSNVFRSLETAGLIQRTGRSRRRIKDRAELINRWVTAFGEELRPTIRRGRLAFRSSSTQSWRDLEFSPALCQWGGEPAAAILTDYLKPVEFSLYTNAKLSEVALNLGLHASKEGEITVFERFWEPGVVSSARQTVHPLLVYADLVISGDPRNLEVARMIYESRLSDIK